MSHTSILRAGFSCFKRIPSTSVLNGVCNTKWNRLMYPRQLEAFSLNQSASFSDERFENQRWGRSDKMKQERHQRYKEGRIQVPEPRIVTSLPPMPTLKGNESFIAIDVLSLPASDGRGIVPFVLCAASSNEKIMLVCKPKVPLFEALENMSGLVYDEASDQVLKSGQPVETVEPSEAMKLFLDFVKRHENPVFLTYSNQPIVKFEQFFKHYNIFEDFKSAVSYKVNTFVMIEKKVSGQRSLAGICKNILNLDLKDKHSMARCEAHLRLFTEYIQPEGNVSNYLSSLDQAWARDTYIELVHNDKLNYIVSAKLSRAGVGLDHLKFLSKKGFHEFEAYLLERNIFQTDVDDLFKIVSNSS